VLILVFSDSSAYLVLHGFVSEDLSSARQPVNHVNKEAKQRHAEKSFDSFPPFLRLLRSSVLKGFPRTSSGCSVAKEFFCAWWPREAVP